MTEMEENGRNIVTLRSYVDTRIAAVEKELEHALRANAIAIAKAEQATEYRLAGLNEFRASMQDQTKRFATKEEVDSARAIMFDRIEALRQMQDSRIESLQRIVWAGLGMLALLEILLKVGLVNWGN